MHVSRSFKIDSVFHLAYSVYVSDRRVCLQIHGTLGRTVKGRHCNAQVPMISYQSVRFNSGACSVIKSTAMLNEK